VPKRDSRGGGPPGRAGLFLAGVVGLPVAAVAAAVLEAALRAGGSEGEASDVLFAAVAGLTPVVALGLMVQLLTALTGRTRSLLREVRRFDEEMSAEEPQLVEESHRDRMVVWATTRRFVHVVVPFGAGVLTQLLATEVAAVTCLVAGVDERFAALALGTEIAVLFVYLILFNTILGRLSAPPVGSRSD